MNRPDLFICGHSHILKVIRDQQLGLLHINPGAAGVHGFHKMRTMIRFDINKGKMENVEVIELGLRGSLT
jgi:predicted phosphodiesterase